MTYNYIVVTSLDTETLKQNTTKGVLKFSGERNELESKEPI